MALEARLAQLTDVQRQRSLVDSELVRRGTNAPFRNEVVVRFARTTPPTSQPAATPNIANLTEAVDKTMALRHDVREAMQSLTLVQRFLRRASEPLVTNTGIAFPACISNHVSSQEGTLGEASVRSAALLHRLRQGTKSSSAAERFAARTNPSAPTQVVEPVGYLTVAVNRVPLQGPGATRVVSIGTANVSGPDSSSHPRDPPTDNIKADAGRGITEVQLPAVTKSGEAPSGRSDAPPATPENADHSKPAPKPALGFAGAGKTTSTSFATPPPKGGSALAFTAKTAAPQPVASKSATVESAQGDQASDVVAAHAPNETPTKKDVAVPVATPQTTPPPALALPGGSKSAASMPAPFKAGHIAFTSKPAAAPKSDTKDAPSPDETPIKQEPAATVAEADGTEDTAILNVASAALLIAEDIASTPSQTPSPSVDGTSVQARPPDDGTAAPTTTALKANPVAKAATLTALAKPAATAATAAPAADGTATSESVAPTATAPKVNAFKSATTAFAKPAATAAPAADGTAAPAAAPGADGGGEVPTAATPPKATAPKSTFSGISPSNTTFGKNKKDDDDDDGDDDGGDKGGSSVALPAPPTTAPMKKTAIGTSPGGFNKVASAFGATTPSTTATGFKSGFAQPKSAWGAPPAQPQQPKQQQQPPPPPTQSAFGGKSSFAAGVATPPPASSGGAFKSAFGGANPWQ